MSRLSWSQLASPRALVVVLVLFAAALALQWRGYASVAVADDIAYVVSGTNLVARGAFVNPFGEPELWFPPAYPLLIGVASVGGRLDPFETARLLSAAVALLTLVLLYRLVRRTLSPVFPPRTVEACALLAAALLASHPVFQTHAVRALSESLATCLVVVALSVVLASPKTWMSAVGAGLATGLATLTRPECVLCLPAWGAVEGWHAYVAPADVAPLARRTAVRATIQRWAVACVTCGLTLLPYVTWLHQYTGRWTFSNKGEVNLAAGRAAFHGTPREFIDPATLDMKYFPVDTSWTVEFQRYVFNGRKLVEAFVDSSPMVVGAVVALVLTAAAVVVLWRRQRVLLLALGATLPYLFVVAAYDVGGAKNLHMALPALVVLQAIGASWLWQQHRQLGRAMVVLLLLGMLESSTRQPRWTLTEEHVPASELREAGHDLRAVLRDEQTGAAGAERAVMYENGATVGYYAGMLRRRLTPNDLPTLLAWIDTHEPADRPVYLALSDHTAATLDASVRALLAEPRPGFSAVLRRPGPHAVVVYRVERAGRRPLALDVACSGRC